MVVHLWIMNELTEYADEKWDPHVRDHAAVIAEVVDAAGNNLFENQLETKLHRAMSVLGLDTPVGKQALLKALVTLFEFAVSMTIAYDGDLPRPGRPSGEIA